MSFILNPYILSRAKIPTENIIQYNKFDNNLIATVGNNGAGTNVDYALGKVGDAVDLTTGNPSLVNFGDDDMYSFTDGTNDLPFSISIWINIPDLPTTGQHMNIISKQSSGSIKEFYIQLHAGTPSIWFYLRSNGSGNNDIARTEAYPTGGFLIDTWYHIVCTYNGSKSPSGINIYINTELKGNTTSSGTYTGMSNSSAPLRLGVINSNAFNFRGYMDEFAMFDKELSLEEVKRIYKRGVSGLPLM